MARYQEIEVRFTNSPDTFFPVGTLAQKDGHVFFEYDQPWLARVLELSPFFLPLQPGLISHQDHRFGPLK